MTDEEVLQVIESAARAKVTELSFRGYGLRRLPPKIGDLTQLTLLNLSGNNLYRLPPEIGQLTQLTRLDLSDNSTVVIWGDPM
jgi:internalin A